MSSGVEAARRRSEELFFEECQEQISRKPSSIDSAVAALAGKLYQCYPSYGSKSLAGLAVAVQANRNNPVVQSVAASVLQSMQIQDESVSLKTMATFCAAAAPQARAPESEAPAASASAPREDDLQKVANVKQELSAKKISPTPSIKALLVFPAMVLFCSAVVLPALLTPILFLGPAGLGLFGVLAATAATVGFVCASLITLTSLLARRSTGKAYDEANKSADFIRSFENMSDEAKVHLFCRLGPDFRKAVLKDAGRELQDLNAFLTIIYSDAPKELKDQAAQKLRRTRPGLVQQLEEEKLGYPSLIAELQEQHPKAVTYPDSTTE